MKLVQLVTRFQRRGAEVFACQLADELAGRGHEVTVVGLYGAAAALAPARARATALKSQRRPIVNPWLVRRLAQELQRLEPDLVQANGSDTLKYASLAKRRSGARWPLVYRNIGIPSRWVRYPGQRYWIRWLLREVVAVVSVSEASRRDFARTYGISTAGILTIPIGTECRNLASHEELRRRLAHEAALEEPGPIVVHVGSFTPEKNHPWLAQAFAAIIERRPDARLILIGEGPGMPEAQAAIARWGLDAQVRLLGAREDAADLAGGADVLVLPSSTEGLPGVVLEAAARGVPAVAWNVGGLSEAIEEGSTGFLVPPRDMGAFTDRVLELIDDPERARRMGSAARARVCARFDLLRVSAAFERLYRELAG